MKKSEVENYKNQIINGIHDIQKSVVPGEVYYIDQLTVYDHRGGGKTFKSSAFKSRPYMVISTKNTMPYGRTICVSVTSNCANRYSIPIIINGKVSFIDPLYQCVFADADFNRKSYCGSVPREIVKMVIYASSRFLGGKYKAKMEEMIHVYQEYILSLIKDGKAVCRKYDGTAEKKLEQIVDGSFDNHFPLGFGIAGDVETNVQDDTYETIEEDDDTRLVYKSDETSFTIGDMLSKNGLNINLDSNSIEEKEEIQEKPHPPLNGTYFTKEGRGRGRKFVLKRPSTLSLKEMSEFLDDMVHFKSYNDFGRVFNTTGQTIRSRAIVACDEISKQNIKIPSTVTIFMESASSRTGGSTKKSN